MSRLTNHNGRYCESEFENAFIGFLENAGWQYTAGSDIHRSNIAPPDTRRLRAKPFPRNLPRLHLFQDSINEQLKSQIKDICPILIKGSIEEVQ